jgi:hypothetical protein
VCWAFLLTIGNQPFLFVDEAAKRRSVEEERHVHIPCYEIHADANDDTMDIKTVMQATKCPNTITQAEASTSVPHTRRESAEGRKQASAWERYC